jgi:amidophosphoribosyltransferase
MPAVKELIAHNRTVEEICTKIGADRLIYQDVDDLIESVRFGNPSIQHFETSCFTGEYITGDVDAEYLQKLEESRCNSAQEKNHLEPMEDVGIN